MENKNKTIILSIHPKHIEKILTGEKRYEYRKRIPLDINYLIVYATAPTKKIVALIEVDMVMKDTPQNIWDVTQSESGVSYEFFMNYFNEVSTSPFVLTNDATKVDAKASPAPSVLTTVAGKSPQ